MASERPIYFSVMNAPGPFHLLMEEGRMYEEEEDQFVVEFKVSPMSGGQKLLGHDYGFKIPFEVALRGTTNKKGLGFLYENESRNVRVLGRFLIPQDQTILRKSMPSLIHKNAASELSQWQWEIIFSPVTRMGLVFKLENPLPEEWTH